MRVKAQKIARVLLLCIFCFSVNAVKRKRMTELSQEVRKRTPIDRVLAIIYHVEEKIVILQSDLRPDLSGQVPSLREAILKELILLDGKKYKLAVSDVDIDRHLARIQESLKKTREDLIEFFKEQGFTFEQARKEIEKGLLIETTVNEVVRSKAFVPESEVKKHYEEHPVIDYQIKQAFVPFGLNSKALTRASIERQIASGDIRGAVEWSEPLGLKESDIDKDKAYIRELQPNGVTIVQESDEGLTLLQLISKTQVPYEALKKQISMELAAKKQREALDQYYENLMKNARIRYLDKH